MAITVVTPVDRSRIVFLGYFLMVMGEELDVAPKGSPAVL